ncbi:MAG: hypothetical protein AB2A00_20800 [Myxococcota bacterium]
MPNPPEKNDPPAPVMTTSSRLARETVERMVGRLATPDRHKLAFTWADRALRVHAVKALQDGGKAAEAERLRALPPVTDEATARAARDAAKGPLQAAEAARAKEEAALQAQGRVGAEVDPRLTATERALSFAVESLKAALGESGLVIRTVAGNTAPAPVVATTSDPAAEAAKRATLASKHAINAAAQSGGGDEEERVQKEEASAILKAPRRL